MIQDTHIPIIDIWAGTFQACWVTNDLDHAMRYLKDKFDIPKFAVMRHVPFENEVYNGRLVEHAVVDGAWANGGKFNLEIVQPKSGYAMEFYGEGLPEAFRLQFHHIGIRFDEQPERYDRAVEALLNKGFHKKFSAGITGMSRFSYFDLRLLLGHYLELIDFNAAGVSFMEQLATGDFESE